MTKQIDWEEIESFVYSCYGIEDGICKECRNSMLNIIEERKKGEDKV